MGETLAHPRGCGEHGIYRVIPTLPMGSSPRVRGTFIDNSLIACCVGLIPAGAGNIHRLFNIVCRKRAHPRGCGEH